MTPNRLPALLLTAILGILSMGTSIAEPLQINGIAAKVNGRVITINEVNFLLRPAFAQLRAEYPRLGEEFETKLKDARDKILNELIDREIILDEYRQLDMVIPDEAIEVEIKNQINKLYGGDKSKLNDELKSMRLTMNKYREMSKEKMIVQAMRQSLFDDVAPPLPNEVRNEYEAIKNDLRDSTRDTVTFHKIFIPAQDARDASVTRETQLALAEDLTKDIKNGKDIAEIAKTHSKDAFAEQGGLQEDVPRFDLSTEFANIIFNSKEGDVIGPLSDESGFIIVKPIKINFGPVPSLSEVRENVEMILRSKKSSAQYEAWLEKRRKRAIIDIKK